MNPTKNVSASAAVRLAPINASISVKFSGLKNSPLLDQVDAVSPELSFQNRIVDLSAALAESSVMVIPIYAQSVLIDKDDSFSTAQVAVVPFPQNFTFRFPSEAVE
jgi:hypothetical protein